VTFSPKLRQSCVHRSLLTFQGFGPSAAEVEIVFQRKTTSANPLSRAHETNKSKLKSTSVSAGGDASSALESAAILPVRDIFIGLNRHGDTSTSTPAAIAVRDGVRHSDGTSVEVEVSPWPNST